MDIVKLKNGSEEAKPLVAVLMMTLRRLFEEAPTAAYDLVQMCRDKTARPWGNNGQVLEEMGLVENGRVGTSVRNVVLSAVSGDGLAMTLSSPTREQSEDSA